MKYIYYDGIIESALAINYLSISFDKKVKDRKFRNTNPYPVLMILLLVNIRKIH